MALGPTWSCRHRMPSMDQWTSVEQAEDYSWDIAGDTDRDAFQILGFEGISARCVLMFPELKNKVSEDKDFASTMASALLCVGAHVRRRKDATGFREACPKCTDYEAQRWGNGWWVRILEKWLGNRYMKAGQPVLFLQSLSFSCLENLRMEEQTCLACLAHLPCRPHQRKERAKMVWWWWPPRRRRSSPKRNFFSEVKAG